MTTAQSTTSLDVMEDNSIESSFTLQMDPASLGLVMEEVHTGTEIPWDEEIGVISDEAIIVEILLCRICAEETADLVSVFEDEGVTLQLADKIRYHLPITVTADDKLPVKVCRSCIARLNSCHELAYLSLDAEEKLTKLFTTDDDKTPEQEKQEEVDSRRTETNRVVYRENSKRPALPSDRLIEAMALLRKEKAKLRAAAETSNQASDGDNSNDDFDAVYLEDNSVDGSEESPVLDVTIEPVGRDSLPAVQWKTANLRVKMPKDFADCDSTLKAQIVGAIQDIMIKEDQSCSTKKKSSPSGKANGKEWKCDICGHAAPRKSSLLVHQRRNHSKSFACGYCYKTFSNGVARAAHERTHIIDAVEISVEDIKQEAEEMVPFQCEYCSKTFKKQKNLHDHTLAHHTDTKPYQCDKCGKAYATLLSLDIHKSTHSTETPYLCDNCGKKFKHASNLRSHKRCHLLEEKKLRQVCDVCGKGFRSRFHLAEHMNVHLDRKAYACDVCGKRFHKKIQLRQHGSTHSGVQPYKCQLCGVRFNRRGNLTQHMKRHERQTKYACKVCSLGFETLGLLLGHRKTHSQDELDDVIRRQVLSADDCTQDAFKCEICGKLLAKKESLLMHLRSHSGEKNFECEVCGKRLSNKGSLTYHMRSYHTGERPYTCQYCPDVFLTKEACSVHERIHTGEKPYSCNICFMGFRCSSNLAQHVRVHSDLRPFQCPQCEKNFIRKGALTVHLRTHTGERPFICDQCGRGFTQKNDMLKHRRTHTLERPFPCNLCGETFGQKRELARHQLAHIDLRAVEEMEMGDNTHTEVITTTDGHHLMQGYSVEVIDSSQTLIEVLHRF